MFIDDVLLLESMKLSGMAHERESPPDARRPQYTTGAGKREVGGWRLEVGG
jgi:hypothetical protein